MNCKYEYYLIEKLYDIESDILDEATKNNDDFYSVVNYANKALSKELNNLIYDTFPCCIHPDYSFEPELDEENILSCINFEETLESQAREDYFANEEHYYREESKYDSKEKMIDDMFDR